MLLALDQEEIQSNIDILLNMDQYTSYGHELLANEILNVIDN